MVFLRSLIYVWALKKKGPVFVVMVKPLGMVAAVILGVTFLGDVLHVGKLVILLPCLFNSINLMINCFF